VPVTGPRGKNAIGYSNGYALVMHSDTILMGYRGGFTTERGTLNGCFLRIDPHLLPRFWGLDGG